jgi:chloramphenicol 3-O-phosphotransferase
VDQAKELDHALLHHREPAMKPERLGHAIFINGIPSAGKSSVAAEINRRTSTLRVLTGDDIIRQIPFQQRVAQANRLFALTLKTIEEWMESSNVMVDGAWTQQQVEQAQGRFGTKGLYVILRIDEAERRRRESIRSDRRLAHRWDPAWLDMPGPDDTYDVVVDSKVMSVAESADTILRECTERWGDVLL